MKKVTIEILDEASRRLLFIMDETQLESLKDEVDSLVSQMRSSKEIKELDGYEPMTFPFECESFLREDEPSECLTVEEVLQNAGSTQDGQIKLPRVVR